MLIISGTPDFSGDPTLTHDYASLAPDQILASLESLGLLPDGRLLALNSYENRVYRAGLEDGNSVVVKFYRPNRWSDEQIQEEHDFSFLLAEQEIPVVAPLHFAQASLHQYQSFRFAVFPNRGGRHPDLENLDQLEQLGRFMGRIHSAAVAQPFDHRPLLNIDTFGYQPRTFILQHDFLPTDLTEAYRSLTGQLLDEIDHCFQRADSPVYIRCHGDCHPSNILWTDDGPHIVDLDDARMAPAVQDLWMFLAGDRAEMTASLDALLSGYSEFFDFDARQLHLIEALRTLRLIHYHGWLARRWDDPAFKQAFPWFNSQKNWEQHILTLREQAALIHEPPLTWMG